MKSQFVLSSAATVVALTLTGCASGWSRPNASDADFSHDKYECEQQAAVMYPVQMMTSNAGYQTPTQTNCRQVGNQTNCTSTPGTAIYSQAKDVNSGARSSAFGSCMRSHGYEFKFGW
jgi:hypothetical protein